MNLPRKSKNTRHESAMSLNNQAVLKERRSIWAWILSASAVLGTLLMILSQIEQSSQWFDRIWQKGKGEIFSQFLRFPVIQQWTAESVAYSYHQNDICVTGTVLADLDRDGLLTDLVFRYIDANKLIQPNHKYTCTELKKDLGDIINPSDERYMVAKSENWSYRVLESFNFDYGESITPLGALLISTYTMTDFPWSTIYGYQSGKLEKLAVYNHMIEFGNEDDDEVEVFDIVETELGAQIRAAEGLFEIVWDKDKQQYRVSPLPWKNVVQSNQATLHIEKNIENSNPVLMFRETPLEVDSSGKAQLYVDSLDRIVFDPKCIPKEGLKNVPNSLGAVVLDLTTEKHEFWCILDIDNNVTVEIKTE